MRKLVWTGVLIFVMSLAAAAADETPTFEVYGGVSWLHIDRMKVAGIKQNYTGWDSEAQFNVNRILGVTADIAGNYGRLVADTPTKHSYTFVFGPTFSFRTQHSTIFAHTLFGQIPRIYTRQPSSAPQTAILHSPWHGEAAWTLRLTIPLPSAWASSTGCIAGTIFRPCW